MGVRGRNSEKKLHEVKVQKLHAALKLFTRSKAEAALANGADPTAMRDTDGKPHGLFTEHANYHVRVRAWVKMGRPLPEGLAEQNKFLLTLQGSDVSRMSPADVVALTARLRLNLLKEQPPVPETEDASLVEASLAVEPALAIASEPTDG
jgi:hypothetical protein